LGFEPHDYVAMMRELQTSVTTAAGAADFVDYDNDRKGRLSECVGSSCIQSSSRYFYTVGKAGKLPIPLT
jgi:hypothetical protein